MIRLEREDEKRAMLLISDSEKGYGTNEREEPERGRSRTRASKGKKSSAKRETGGNGVKFVEVPHDHEAKYVDDRLLWNPV